MHYVPQVRSLRAKESLVRKQQKGPRIRTVIAEMRKAQRPAQMRVQRRKPAMHLEQKKRVLKTAVNKRKWKAVKTVGKIAEKKVERAMKKRAMLIVVKGEIRMEKTRPRKEIKTPNQTVSLHSSNFPHYLSPSCFINSNQDSKQTGRMRNGHSDIVALYTCMLV